METRSVTEHRKSIHSTLFPKEERPFLQPLAVALVCLVFIALFLVVGVINLNTLDETLAGFMRNEGLAVVRNVQQVAERFFQQLGHTPQALSDFETNSSLDEEAISLQESLLIDLMDLAREIDLKEETEGLSQEQFLSILDEENLQLIAFLDERGRITFKNRSVPEEILRQATPVVRGHEELKINIFERSESTERLGFIALRRKWGKGTVILAVDDEGFRDRYAKHSTQKAIEEMISGPDMTYVIMMDRHGRVLGQTGKMIENRREQLRMENILNGKIRVKTRKLTLGEQNVLEIAAPVYVFGEFTGIMLLGFATDVPDQILKKSKRSIFMSTSFMVFIVFLSLWVLYKTQNRYLARVQEMERRVHQAERLSALGRLGAGVAHEIRNPLNAISMAIQRLQRDTPHKLIGVIRDEIRRLNHIIEEFLSISKSRELEFKRYDLTILLKQILLLMGEQAQAKGIQLRTQWCDAPFMVFMDADKMKQALINVIKNAMESIPDEGSITLSVKSENKEWGSIKISDTGTGLSPEEKNHIFDLDYTTKDKGLGLGLPLAHEIIRGHGGEIHVSSRPGAGTIFEIRLPLDKQ
jgi:signal transduction histidine kinase